MDYKLLVETRTTTLDKLIRVYKENPFKARVMFFNSPQGHTQDRIVYYDNPDGWAIVHYVRTFGISVTNKMWNREMISDRIVFKDGKFHRIYNMGKNKCIRILNVNQIDEFVKNCNAPNSFGGTIRDLINSKHSWVRFVVENKTLHNKPFNAFIKFGLYNLNDSIKHFFKVPLPQAKILNKHFTEKDSTCRTWPDLLPQLTHIESLTAEQLNNYMFIDLCRMAKTLGRKVNCGWSEKRVTLEHNTWAREIGHILLECEEERPLKIADVYLKFADFSGYQLLKTNKEMMMEGLVQDHCVATYIDHVDKGRCGIYHIKNYTLEVRQNKVSQWHSTPDVAKQDGLLIVGQFQAFHNTPVPWEMRKEVADKIDEFNKTFFVGNELDEEEKRIKKILRQRELMGLLDNIAHDALHPIAPLNIITPPISTTEIVHHGPIYARPVPIHIEPENLGEDDYEF